MSIPQHSLSSENVSGVYLYPDIFERSNLTDYESGAGVLNDPDLGMFYQTWTVTYSSPDVIVTPENAGPTVLFSLANITELSIAFDQNMNPFIAYVVNGEAWFWWYDTSQALTVHTQLPIGVLNPRCTLDDKRDLQKASSDIILAYTMDANFYTREQRDRFGVVDNKTTTPDAFEYLMGTTPIGKTLDNIGMGNGFRLLFKFK